MLNIEEYWKASLRQDASAMKTYFAPDAWIRWHNTNEQFTVDEFIRVNCEYPNTWNGDIERVEYIDDLIITAVHVFSKDLSLSFHVTSFIKIQQDKIISIDEYWGDDDLAPKWRLDMHIGKSIQS